MGFHRHFFYFLNQKKWSTDQSVLKITIGGSMIMALCNRFDDLHWCQHANLGQQ